MEIIDIKTVERVFNDLTRGVTLNTKIGIFFRALANALQHTDFANKGISAKATADGKAIAIVTPHGDVVGTAEHIRDDNTLAVRITFSVIQTGADDKKEANEVMTIEMSGQGHITKVHESQLAQVLQIEPDLMYEVGVMVLARVQDNLDSTGATFFSI
ncbi:hypothetical protein [Burkholderia cepacia]|uniref:hypothetical protein n=1 Tax=Burkholderia cepacia TaxID=292 RepID=UPI00398F2D0E